MMEGWADFLEGNPFMRRLSDAGKIVKEMREADPAEAG